MRNSKRFVFMFILGWLFLNGLVVAIFGGVIYQAYRLAQAFNLIEAHNTLKQARIPLTAFRYTSLGTYRLPGVYYWYQLLDQGLVIESHGYELLDQAQDVLSDSLRGAPIEQKRYIELQLAYERFTHLALPFCQNAPCDQFFSEADTLIAVSNRISALLLQLPSILGSETPKRYLILFQNNMELRPTGGFLGSYADLTFDKGALKNLAIQDIYVPDGQIKGYVTEPAPIRRYLFDGEHPGWRLRDSNWNPDFPTAAGDMRWFFNEGGVGPIDGMIAINLFPIIDALRIVGSVHVPDYAEKITADTFYQAAQYHAEHNFFPGSTQKRDFLSAIGTSLLSELLTHSRDYLLPLLPKVYAHLQEKQITAFLYDQANQQPITDLGWDGSIRIPPCPADKPGCVMDYLSINEANVGINKTNCCIDRQFKDDVVVGDGGQVTHHLTLTYTNRNPPTPEPPVSWGGGYKNYVRLIMPAGALVQGLDEMDVVSMGNLQTVGFVILTEGGQQTTTTISYTLPPTYTVTDTANYRLAVQKQSGVDSIPFAFTIFGTEHTITLKKDIVL